VPSDVEYIDLKVQLDYSDGTSVSKSIRVKPGTGDIESLPERRSSIQMERERHATAKYHRQELVQKNRIPSGVAD
jgi:hypothetical protein